MKNQTETSNSDGQHHECQTRIEIFTDGSCIGNPGHGGYGIVTLRRDPEGQITKCRERFGFALEITTNVRMEMTAVCVALERLGSPSGEPISVYCDANLIPNAMNEWLDAWKANGWKKGNGKAPDNRDLWQRLERAAEGRNVRFLWIRGHNGDEHNERADKLAYAAARKAEQRARYYAGAWS
ncbi:ribonuclease H [uncultured Paracoccus sp.]|uniref:ribonuclease H family protein n=1 Tax=uncultured Paracoccus sp. TaxID=189685 RepID=UPI002620AA83|nr:ribonuclease H [uncultured Paracoccus sp.]